MVSSEHLWIQIYSTFFIFFYRDAVDERAAKEKKRQIKKYLMIGAAAVGGGTLIGVTGGLAAPLVIGRYLMRETFVTKDCLFITTCLTVIIGLSKDSIFILSQLMNFDDYNLLLICFLIAFLYPQIHFDW